MKGPQREPGAETGAESAEVRKARNGAGSRAVGKCGRSAEEVRKHSDPLPSTPSAGPDPGPAAALPLALVRKGEAKPREEVPAPAPCRPVKVESMEWGWVAVGTRDELLQAGLCKPAHFPAGRKRVAVGADESGADWLFQAQRGGRWKLSVSFPSRDRRLPSDIRRAEEAARVASMTAAEWRAECLGHVDFGALMIRRAASPPDSVEFRAGFTIDAGSMRLVNLHLEAVRSTIEAATVRFDPALRGSAISQAASELQGAAHRGLSAPLRLVKPST